MRFYGARWICPVAADGDPGRLIENGAVITQEERIIAVGSRNELLSRYPAAKIMIDRSGPDDYCLIIPGLINSHSHSALSLLRGVSDNDPLEEWLQTVWKIESQLLSEEFVALGTRLAIREGLLSGCTCFNDMYYFNDVTRREFERAGVRSFTGVAMATCDFVPHIEVQFNRAMENIAEWYSPQNPFRLQQPIFCPHSLYTVPGEYFSRGLQFIADLESSPKASSREIKFADQQVDCATGPHTGCGTKEINKARSDYPEVTNENRPPHQNISSLISPLRLPLHTHLNETLVERRNFERAHNGVTSLEWLQSIGALNSRLIAVHMVHLLDHEISLLGSNQVNICHCPRSNMKLGSGICRVMDLIRAGANVCLGTDSACSNNSVDMLAEMQYAALLSRVRRQSPFSTQICPGSPPLTPAMVLEMATLNGAKALGISSVTGSLEPGKAADFVLVDLKGEGGCGLPVLDPLSNLVFSTSRRVTDIVVAGKLLLKDGVCLTLNCDDTAALQDVSQKILACK